MSHVRCLNHTIGSFEKEIQEFILKNKFFSWATGPLKVHLTNSFFSGMELKSDDESQKSVNAYNLHRNIDICEWLS